MHTLNTKAVKFRAQVGIGRFSELEKPFFVQIIVKMAVRMLMILLMDVMIRTIRISNSISKISDVIMLEMKMQMNERRLLLGGGGGLRRRHGRGRRRRH